MLILPLPTLGCRLMVGQQSLELPIGVRIPAPQPLREPSNTALFALETISSQISKTTEGASENFVHSQAKNLKMVSLNDSPTA